MNDALGQFLGFLKSLPPLQKLSIGFTVVLLAVGFAAMFFWANQIDYQVLFSNLSHRDAGAIIAKLEESNVPYRVGGSGTLVLVPAEKVHELRLSMAGEGLPKEGNVGFELFDQTDFGATKFVQELNYRRALQGELARSINQFREVISSRVFIALPKESLFIEEEGAASASIQLDLRSDLPPNRLAAIVHLVANAIEGLDPEHVTLVDTKGRVIFKGESGNDSGDLLSSTQLDYKVKLEDSIRRNVQSMLEGILGARKAIVRVIADIEFNRITEMLEEYDPTATVVRSQSDVQESSQTAGARSGTGPSRENRRTGVIPSSTEAGNERRKSEVATNYEINKIVKETIRPAGSITRLSVAAVVDGTYEVETLADGTTQRTYVPRTSEELRRIEEIVKSAMGFSEDREDQVSVESFPFSEPEGLAFDTPVDVQELDPVKLLGEHKGTIINVFLVILVFMLLVRPLLRGLRSLTTESTARIRQLQTTQEEYAQIPEGGGKSVKEKALEIYKENPEKTEQQVLSWISE